MRSRKSDDDCEDRVSALEDEIRLLKRQLAAKAVKVSVTEGTARGDAFAHLPKPDREWLVRRSGGKTRQNG